MKKRDLDSFVCPNCGADVPGRALACPECGSDDQTGWSADTTYDDLDLPNPDDESEVAHTGTKANFWQAVAMVVVILILLLALMGLW